MSGIIISPYTFASTGGGGDLYFSNVVALLHMNGSDGSTTITDQKSHTFSVIGSSTISTAESKFGGASYSSVSNSQVRSADSSDWDFGSGDFTLELWVYSTNNSAIQGMLSKRVDGSVYSPFVLFSNPSNSNLISCYLSTSNTAWDIQLTSTTALTTGSWIHVAVTRSGTTFRLFVNGTLEASTTGSSALITNSANLVVGGFSEVTYQYIFIGYIDDVRLTKGVARYTASFTPPSAQFPDA